MESQPNHYAPPKSQVADVMPADQVQKAERVTRLGAVILDSIIFSVPFVPGYFLAFGALAQLIKSGQTPAGFGATYVAMIAAMGIWFWLGGLVALGLVALTIFWVHRDGQTIAKKALGIKVVRSNGERASLGRIFWLRNVVNSLFTFIPVLGGIYALVDGLFIFSDARQCLHDKLADTIVIKA